MPVVAVARHAMNTRFEVLLHGTDPVTLRAAADEALNEIERIEAQLSLFRPPSEIARVNRRAASEPVRVSPPVFRLLRRAQELSFATQGAFDPTVAPLLRAWGFLGGRGSPANADELTVAGELVGMHRVQLDESAFTVQFPLAGMMLDLGAIGKGYAIDCAVEVLRESGVENGFIHGGTSSCYALGTAEGGSSWRVAINEPGEPERGRARLSRGYEPSAATSSRSAETGGPPSVQRLTAADASPALPSALGMVGLRDESLGVSAIGTKAFQRGGQTYGHVIDPRSGNPVQAALLAAVVLPSATDTDALSTALLTLGQEGLPLLQRLCPRGKFLVAQAGPSVAEYRIQSIGFDGPTDESCVHRELGPQRNPPRQGV